MDDNRIEIVASLDIPKTVSTIKKDLVEVSKEINSTQALKIDCCINTKNIGDIQKQLNEVSKGLKLNVGGITTSSITKDVQADADAIIQAFDLVASKIGGKKNDLRKALVEPIREFKEAYATGDIEKAWTNLSSVIQKASREIYVADEALLTQQKELKESLRSLGKISIDTKSYDDLKYMAGGSREAANIMTRVFGVGNWTKTSKPTADALDSIASDIPSLKMEYNDLAQAVMKFHEILTQDVGKVGIFDSIINQAENATDAINAVASVLKLPQDVYEDIPQIGIVAAVEKLPELAKEMPVVASTISQSANQIADSFTKINDNYPLITNAGDTKSILESAKNTLNNAFGESGDKATRVKRAIEDTSGELQRFYVQVEKGDKSIETLTYALNEQGNAYEYLGKTIREADNSTDFRRKGIDTQWSIQTEKLQQFIANAEKAGVASTTLKNDIANLQEKLNQKGNTNAMNAFLDDFDIAKAKLQALNAVARRDNFAESLSIRVKKLSADMKAYAAANERAVKSTKQMSDGMTFTDKWSSLSQMAQNADLTDRELKKLVADMAVFKKEASAAGISGASAFDKFAKSFKLVSTYISANQLINMAISKIREAVEELKNVDNILTEISKTSERSAESLSKLGKGSFDVASKYGRTASDYLLGVQEMSRAGFGEVESENLAQLSLLAQSAGDMTAELANEYIIATNAAYGYQGSLDGLNDVLD